MLIFKRTRKGVLSKEEKTGVQESKIDASTQGLKMCDSTNEKVRYLLYPNNGHFIGKTSLSYIKLKLGVMRQFYIWLYSYLNYKT